MQHLGDITKISGYTAPVVDCIIGGSPCQDLSVAGKRAGLDGERSGLYMEQIRIVKEMRENDRHNGRSGVDVRPRYMVWENVPGAFSSNKAEDFRIVLEELAKIADEDAVVPVPPKGKWTNNGCIMGDGWSIAWRVLDAQFWGVPQRRRRIALVADFGGQSAPEILFVRESVSRNPQPSKPKRKATSGDASRGAGVDDKQPKLMDAFQHHGWRESDTCGTLTTGQNNTVRGDTPLVCYGISSYSSNAMKSSNPHSGIYEADTSRTLDLNGGNPSCNQGGIAIVAPVPYTLKIRSGCEGGGKGALIQTDKSATLSTLQDQTLFQPVYQDKVGSLCARDYKGVGSQYVDEDKLVVCVDQGGGKSACNVTEGQSPTLTCTHGGEPAVIYERIKPVVYDGSNITSPTNAAKPRPGDPCHTIGTDSRNLLVQPTYCIEKPRYIVRRLTPLECERLQGYPDGWTDIGEWVDSSGKKRQTTDTARYKALGNSIALPPWKWVLKRLCACYERDATMASLFDGIGGFPYLWEQLNGKGSCRWASEIEEFPMAVTKSRIG